MCTKVHSGVRAVSTENVWFLPAITDRGGNDYAHLFSLISRVGEPLIWTECFFRQPGLFAQHRRQNGGLIASHYHCAMTQEHIKKGKQLSVKCAVEDEWPNTIIHLLYWFLYTGMPHVLLFPQKKKLNHFFTHPLTSIFYSPMMFKQGSRTEFLNMH